MVLNHMTGDWPSGTPATGGSSFNTGSKDYPAVPFSTYDFNGRDKCSTSSGNIENYGVRQHRSIVILRITKMHFHLMHRTPIRCATVN